MAARRIGVEVVVGSNRRQVLEDYSHGGTLTLNFRDTEIGTQQIVDYAKEHALEAIVSVDDEALVLAAKASSVLGLPHNSLESIFSIRNKFRMREKIFKAGLPSPEFHLFSIHKNPEQLSSQVNFPCVLKPTFLAASRGVIRANHPKEFKQAFHRIKSILKDPEVKSLGGESADEILVEDYIPGQEVALEGLMMKGELQVLALFDKPDPLEGPFFEETIYVTPSRLPPFVQEQVVQNIFRSAQALGLMEGPIHAELRFNENGSWLVELSPRTIGGLCSRTLRFGTGLTLEEIVLRHALRLPINSMEREKKASGVMMIPIPKSGILKKITGKEKAKKVLGVEEVSFLIPTGQQVISLPEGHRYLGFIFARGETPAQVESSLREAHRNLEILIDPA
jgi:biotin carboxylase